MIGKRLPALALWLPPSHVFRRNRIARQARENCLGVKLPCFELCADNDNKIIPSSVFTNSVNYLGHESFDFGMWTVRFEFNQMKEPEF